MGIARSTLLWISDNKTLRRTLPKLWFVRKAVKRFMPGESVDDAVAAAQTLKQRSINTIFTQLGENITVATEADAVRDELATVAAQRSVELFIDVDPALAVSGDPFLLQRALSNLVLNAVDFAPAESAVTVDAQATRGRVDITVRDHGPGIPPYAADRLFEKFFSTPRPGGRKGTGLGLAFVREVAQLHGGNARLANHPEGGAVATLSIPRP